MSRELQDVDLAEVKPLVEKGEVSGDAPGCHHHTWAHVCAHIHTHVHCLLVSTGHLVQECKGTGGICSSPSLATKRYGTWARPLAHLSVLYRPHFTYPAMQSKGVSLSTPYL